MQIVGASEHLCASVACEHFDPIHTGIADLCQCITMEEHADRVLIGFELDEQEGQLYRVDAGTLDDFVDRGSFLEDREAKAWLRLRIGAKADGCRHDGDEKDLSHVGKFGYYKYTIFYR